MRWQAGFSVDAVIEEEALLIRTEPVRVADDGHVLEEAGGVDLRSRDHPLGDHAAQGLARRRVRLESCDLARAQEAVLGIGHHEDRAGRGDELLQRRHVDQASQEWRGGPVHQTPPELRRVAPSESRGLHGPERHDGARPRALGEERRAHGRSDARRADDQPALVTADGRDRVPVDAPRVVQHLP